MKPRLIVIDGKTYTSVNEMPEDIRQKYEQAMGSFKEQNQNPVPDVLAGGDLFGDKNNNGIPDLFENGLNAGTVIGAMKVIMDGKQIDSVNGLPPEARARYDQAMSALDANKNGVPDFMEQINQTPQQTSTVSTSFESAPPPRSQPLSASPTITPDTSNGWMLALLGVLLLMACAFGAVGIWYFFIR